MFKIAINRCIMKLSNSLEVRRLNMDVFKLKIIALTSMIIDHYGAVFQSNIPIYRIVGRIAFPIYCFLLVEGYTHTSNIKRYATRLLIFALISEIPFDLAFYGGLDFSHQNIFFTLFIGLITMYLLDKQDEDNGLGRASIIIGAFILAMVFSVDYNYIGIIYILLFYRSKDYPKSKKLQFVALTMFVVNLVSTGWIQQFSLLALPIIYLYNKELGPKNKFSQFLFYGAYPLHLFIFYLLNVM